MAGTHGCAFNYVVTANKPTHVTASVIGHFTSQEDLNLIIAKSTRLEIWTLTSEGLKGVADVPIYGRIAALKLFRPPGEDMDLIFLSTERYMFCVLAWDAKKGELVTKANGNVEDRVGRPTDEGQLIIIDPLCRLIGMHLYHGLFKVIPIDAAGKMLEAYNMRIDEQEVLDIKFLHVAHDERPTIAVLYQDIHSARHVKTYEVGLKDKELHEGPWAQRDLDNGANMIIPIPGQLGGAVVLGENVLAYFKDSGPPRVTPIQPTIIVAYGRVDEDGSRWLLGDHIGRLWLLVLSAAGGAVSNLRLEPLGTITAPSALSYLDNGVVYVGSQRGDSQLVRLSAQPTNPEAVAAGAQPSFVEVLENYTSLGPIVDFAVVDLERQGQGQVVTCSGVGSSGSLRIVRNGIGMIEQATVELPGIKGIWSLKASSIDAYDTYLVLTFVGETRTLAITADDELDEAELPGFNADAQTLYCGNAAPDQIVQITHGSLRLLDAGTKQLTQEWRPPDGMSINVAAASPTQALLAVGESDLVALALGEGSITETAHIKLDSEIACLDITPLGEDNSATFAAVGTWALGLHTFRLPGLQEVAKEQLGGEVIPRSVLIADFEAGPHLLCALGDGSLFNFRLDPSAGTLRDRKRVSLGTKPINLRSFSSGGARHVFAASDRPAVIYSANKKLLYSNVNESEVTFMTSFNSASFPDSLAIAKEGSMTIGTIDEIQKLHIRTVPLGEQPRRIAHQEAARSFAVAVERQDFGSPDNVETCAIRLVDDQTFETTDRFALDTSEQAISIVSGTMADDPQVYFLVGTAYAVPEEPEPTKGRILVLQAKEGKLSLVSERETKGAVWTLNAFQGRVLASINNRVQLYKWAAREGGARDLAPECGWSGHVCALYVETRGDFILVGDLMKSLQLLVYKAEEGAIAVRARDYHTNWMTAAAILDDDTYLGAENSYNLFTLCKNSDSAADEERNHLEVIGEYHLGEFVNRFRPGSLVMKLPDSEAANVPTLLFGTISGVIGLVASLPPQRFDYLVQLQTALRAVIKGVGGLDHAAWRAFQNERTTAEARGFVDGDLIEQVLHLQPEAVHQVGGTIRRTTYEQFLDLRPEAMQQVAAAMGGDTTVDELSKVVEELQRLH